ncbi:MAG: UDP-N-acetylmuramoyl-tripeptide--D-alanyl-D-alanine ligase [Chitinophagaceae bacterium]|nr:UDP-N-acetylmuramoyl-tripeptide--D-alanyl-D-alanine ligase [Chitinophagaceae bacterium]
MEIKDLYEIYLRHPSITTDTRKLQKGDLYFALKGPNFNGNKFAVQALKDGAAFAIVDEETGSDDNRIIRVDDVLTTLQELASYHRDQFKIPFIAITGSNGKTTTKELIHAVLSSHFITYTTTGNLNNHIGIPLTILKVKSDAQIAVIEMGANHLGEISGYCRYAKPNYGLITNIGKAHLEGFGGAEGVKKGKGELFKYLENNGGHAFVNADDPNVFDLSRALQQKTFYGKNAEPSTGKLVSSDPFLNVKLSTPPGTIIKTHLVGGYNAPNIFAAAAVGHYFGVPDEKIKAAIEEYNPTNSRSQMIQKNTNTIILDAYNANPGSMKAAVENFAAMKGENKILFLGDMKELGQDSEREHAALVELLKHYPWKQVILTGPEFARIKHPFLQFQNSTEARDWYRNNKVSNSLILVKGSRSMAMEKVIE